MRTSKGSSRPLDRFPYYAILLSLTQLPELSWTGPTGLLHSKNLGAEPFPPLSSTMRTRSSKLTDGSESSPGTLSRISSNGLDSHQLPTCHLLTQSRDFLAGLATLRYATI